jgi:tetratricopeptide (TPR) repeat protein
MTAVRKLPLSSSAKIPKERGPLEHLALATRSASPLVRERHARLGLAAKRRISSDTQALLLRQLSAALYEQDRMAEAWDACRQALAAAKKSAALEDMLDVYYQDAARSALALSRENSRYHEHAITKLRLAAQVCPKDRRAFHLWSLGNVYFFAQRYAEAIATLAEAARPFGSSNALYEANLVLAKIAGGELVEDVSSVFQKLAGTPAAKGHGAFVLGHLAYAAGNFPVARRYLAHFVARNASPVKLLSLADELSMTESTLAKMRPTA